MSDQNTILADILTDETKIFIWSAGMMESVQKHEQVSEAAILTLVCFIPLASFYTPWKLQKSFREEGAGGEGV